MFSVAKRKEREKGICLCGRQSENRSVGAQSSGPKAEKMHLGVGGQGSSITGLRGGGHPPRMENQASNYVVGFIYESATIKTQ